jgi:hypothetical protein
MGEEAINLRKKLALGREAGSPESITTGAGWYGFRARVLGMPGNDLNRELVTQ